MEKAEKDHLRQVEFRASVTSCTSIVGGGEEVMNGKGGRQVTRGVAPTLTFF